MFTNPAATLLLLPDVPSPSPLPGGGDCSRMRRGTCHCWPETSPSQCDHSYASARHTHTHTHQHTHTHTHTHQHNSSSSSAVYVNVMVTGQAMTHLLHLARSPCQHLCWSSRACRSQIFKPQSPACSGLKCCAARVPQPTPPVG
jgi:hypothetical protein